ncbi:MAG: apolipoprotein N-acyltransferase, partial [Gammaproteobacteria bacterium]
MNLHLNHRWNYLFSLLAGGLMVFGYAPFNLIWLVFVCLAWLLLQWRDASAKQALLHGWLFGIGMQAAGVSWIYVSLHYHGATPTPFAVLLIVLLSMYLAIYPALAGFLVARFCRQGAALKLLLLFPAAWALTEWLQGIVMTGFGWMQIGYTQIDLPLAGYAPLIGAQGIGLLLMLSAGALVLMLNNAGYRNPRFWSTTGVLVAAIWLGGFGFKQVHWTQPEGVAISVALVQGNIAQKLKWRRDMHDSTMLLYR